MEIKKLRKLMAKGRLKAIIKDLPGGRRLFVGFERSNPLSRKARVKFFSKPIDMASLNTDDAAAISNIRSDVTQPPTPENEKA